MRRRFRPSLGRIELKNKGGPDNATASGESTTPTPPIRRARIKPKVGIVGSSRSGCVTPRRDQAKSSNDPERSESRIQPITVTSANKADAGPIDNVHVQSTTNANRSTTSLQDGVPTDINWTSSDINQVPTHAECTDSENAAQEKEKDDTVVAAKKSINSQVELNVTRTNNEGNQMSSDHMSLQTECTDNDNVARQREIENTTLGAAQSTINLQDEMDINRTNNEQNQVSNGDLLTQTASTDNNNAENKREVESTTIGASENTINLQDEVCMNRTSDEGNQCRSNQVSNYHSSLQTECTSHDNAFQANTSLEGNSIVNASNEHSLSECETLSAVPEVQDNVVSNAESDHCNNDSVVEQMEPCHPVLMDTGSSSGQTTRTIDDSHLTGILSCDNVEPNTQEPSSYVVIRSQVSPSTFDFSQLQFNAEDLLRSLLQNASGSSLTQSLPCENVHATTDSQQMASIDLENSESAVCNNRPRQTGGNTNSGTTKKASSSSSVTSSRLITKRRYTKPRNRIPRQPTFRVDSENRVSPNEFDIASNVVISDDLNNSDTPAIDHPILELPDDLIQNNDSENSLKRRKNVKGLRQRFRQRNCGAVKVVVSRRTSENVRDSCSQEEDVGDLSKEVQQDSRKERGETVKRRKVAPNVTHLRGKTKRKNQQEQSERDGIVSNVGKTSVCCVIGSDGNSTGNQSNVAHASSFENLEVENQDPSGGIVDSTLSNSVEVMNGGVVSASSAIPEQDDNSITITCTSASSNELGVVGQGGITCEPNLSSNVEVIDQGTTNVEPNTCVSESEDQSNETDVPVLPNICNAVEDDRQKSVEHVAHRKRRVAPNLTQVRRKNKNTQSINEQTEVGAISQDKVGRVSEVSMVKNQGGVMTGSHSSNECESENNDCVTSVCVSSNDDEELPGNMPDDTLNEIPGNIEEANRQRERNVVSRKRRIEPNLSQRRRKNKMKDPQDVVEAKEVPNQDVGSLTKEDLVEDQYSVTVMSSLSSTTENCGPVVSDSSNNLEDISLNIPQSTTGEFLHNTDEPLLSATECAACPEVLTSVTTSERNPGDGLQEVEQATLSGVHEQMSGSSAAVEFDKNQHTAAGISSDSVAPSTTTGDPANELQPTKGKRVVKRGRKAKGMTVDDGVTEGSKGTEDSRDPEGSEGTQKVQGVNEGSQLQDTRDPVQATESASNGSGGRKRKGKAVKPKVPAKRVRKKAANKEPSVVAGETGEEHEQGGTVDNSTGEQVAAPDAQNKEENTTVQKKKGCGKSSRKSTNTSTPCDVTSEEVTSVPKKKGRRQARTERNPTAVNISQMRISDMAYYNPKTNPMKEPTNVQETIPNPQSVQNTETEVILPPDVCSETQTTPVLAPQVTIDADGNIVLDEDSLLIQSAAAGEDVENREVVFENANQQYRATLKKKPIDRWKKDETVYFYEILSQVGTDFTLMAKLFPTRDRKDLKKKFKREEKVNRDLIEKALNQRNPIPASLFAECLEETEEEMERALTVGPQETVTQA